MAHWIIEDKGFGGTVYQCSECKDVWNDLFHKDISSISERCPGCGVLLNEDEIEYVEHKRKGKEKTMKEPLDIKIKYFDKAIEPITKIDKGDWIDLRAAETITLLQGEIHPIRLGVGMILPEGYEAHLAPRSSTLSKFGILCGNSVGIVDNSYSGDEDEWKFLAYAIRNTEICKGDRICQFRIMKKQPEIDFEVVEHLNDISRGGFGSTGIK